MIRARHTWLGEKIVNYYAGPALERAFQSISFSVQATDHTLPVLMIANHFCWWDGFIQYRLNRLFCKRKFHVMMLEEQLNRYPFLNQCGAFSVRKGSREVLTSLDYCRELLQDPENMVLIFPQGEIKSIYTGYLEFQKGIWYLLKHLGNPVEVVFNVNLVDYFSAKKPGLTIYCEDRNPVNYFSLEELEQDFNSYYGECCNKQGE